MNKTDKEIRFYETTDENKAKNPSGSNIPAGGLVFVKGATSGKIYRDGKPFGGGGEDEKFPEDAESAGVTIGGLEAGGTIAGKSVKQVLEDMIYPEYAPYFVDATSAISCKSASDVAIATNTVLEVGQKTPAKAKYTMSATPAKVIGNSTYTAENGTPTKTQSITTNGVNDNTTTDSAYDCVTTKTGSFVVRNRSVCAKGTTTVKTNKGNETDKVGGSATSRTLLSAASVNTTNIEAAASGTGKVVKATTKDASHTIIYVYKLYATTVTAGTLTEQSLNTTSPREFTLKGGSGGQWVAVPKTYTGIKIEEYNATLNSWTDVTGTWTNTTETSYNDAAETSRKYTVWKRANNSGSDVRMRITYTRAN